MATVGFACDSSKRVWGRCGQGRRVSRQARDTSDASAPGPWRSRPCWRGLEAPGTLLRDRAVSFGPWRCSTTRAGPPMHQARSFATVPCSAPPSQRSGVRCPAGAGDAIRASRRRLTSLDPLKRRAPSDVFPRVRASKYALRKHSLWLNGSWVGIDLSLGGCLLYACATP